MDEDQKLRLLKKEAAALEALLVKYGGQDEKIGEILKLMTPLFRKIEKGLLRPPYREDFSAYFVRDVDDGFGGVRRRYQDVFHQYVRYASVIDDQISWPSYKQDLIDAGEEIWWEN